MEEKRKIRMPIGAAVACLLIVALLTVGIVAGAKFINNSLSASQTEKNASVQATSAPSGSNGTVGSSGDKTGDLPSDKLSYAGSSARPDSEYKTIENCMSSVVSIDVTAQSGHKSVLAGSGSGVIISADGYIVTCNHVVEGAQKIFVYLDNGNDYEATLVGTDSVTDLAVIKINAYNLNYAKFGDSSTLSVGEDVFAIGNALGQLSNTYTRGSISGLDRSITIDNVTMTLLQTDAAINQGNSGGGLFRESDGTLIGIVNAKSSGSGIEGLGFAIPSTLAREVIGNLMDYGFVVGRPYLGVSPYDHGDGAAGGGQIAALQRVIDLHGLVPQGLDRQDLPAHHTLQRQTQPRADQTAQPQQQSRDGGGYDDHRAPQNGTRRPLAGRRFGAYAPQHPLQHADTFSNQNYRMGKTVGVAHQKVYAKADNKCRKRPHHAVSPPPCIVKI